MQISKFSFAWACLAWEGMVLRDSQRQEDPINRGLQRTLGPWHQDPTACAEAGRQQSTTKATFKTPEWTEEEGLRVRRPLCRKVGDALSHTWAANRPCCAASPRCPDLSGACYGKKQHPEEGASNRSGQFATNSPEGTKGLLSFLSL